MGGYKDFLEELKEEVGADAPTVLDAELLTEDLELTGVELKSQDDINKWIESLGE